MVAKRKVIDMRDLEADPIVMFQKKYFEILFAICSIGVPVLFPWYFLNASLWSSFWVMFNLRFCVTLNIAFFINSVAHMFGRKPYDKWVINRSSSESIKKKFYFSDAFDPWTTCTWPWQPLAKDGIIITTYSRGTTKQERWETTDTTFRQLLSISSPSSDGLSIANQSLLIWSADERKSVAMDPISSATHSRIRMLCGATATRICRKRIRRSSLKCTRKNVCQTPIALKYIILFLKIEESTFCFVSLKRSWGI